MFHLAPKATGRVALARLAPLARRAALVLLAAAGVAHASNDLNTASQAELERVGGVGPALSARILLARQASRFDDWEDLRRRVPGLGSVVAARLSREGWTVSGSAYAATDSDLSSLQPKKRKTSSRRVSASDSPSAMSARVNGASKSR